MDPGTLYSFVAFAGQIGSWEIVLIFAVLLVVFGPRRLPEIARSLGKAIDQLQRFSREFHDQIITADIELPDNEKSLEDNPDLQQENAGLDNAGAEPGRIAEKGTEDGLAG